MAGDRAWNGLDPTTFKFSNSPATNYNRQYEEAGGQTRTTEDYDPEQDFIRAYLAAQPVTPPTPTGPPTPPSAPPPTAAPTPTSSTTPLAQMATQEGFGLSQGTELDHGLGYGVPPASSTALAQMARKQGRIY